MGWNVTTTDDLAASDTEAWETIEVAPLARVGSIRRKGATLAGGLLVLGAVVGAGLWPVGSEPSQTGSEAETCPPTEDAVSSPPGAMSAIGPTPLADASTHPSPIVARSPIVLIMPAHGEVVLGDVMAIAGRVTQTRDGPGEANVEWLHVVITTGAAVLGEADLRVVEQGFVGWVPIDAPARGQSGDVRISDGRRPDHILFEQEVVLGPGR